ncbi:hypothetical protein [Bacillus haynesii]|uniref:hypothetical protein n=1 Tax=Bacillus haynesii TaxID=1925021 RepID=UPI0003ED9EE7|nr:hypothetical protein [Bacillus haynesii]EWH19811.1 hypothetical protein M769_0124910 [Bacillus haynesii]
MILSNINWAEIANLISSILESKFVTNVFTSWPLAAVIIVFALKKSFINIIETRLSSVKFGNNLVEAIFGKRYDETINVVEQKNQSSLNNPKEQKEQDFNYNKEEIININGEEFKKKKIKTRLIKLDFDNFEEKLMLAMSNPKKLIEESWNSVQNELSEIINLYSFQGITDKEKSSKIDLLETFKIISPELAKALMQLSVMRNLLLVQNEPNSGEAFEFFSRCKRAIDQLRWIT